MCYYHYCYCHYYHYYHYYYYCYYYSEYIWRCSFENDGGIFACDIEQSTDDNFDWLVKSGRTSTPDTGPDGAVSGMKYAYIEASNHKTNEEAW